MSSDPTSVLPGADRLLDALDALPFASELEDRVWERLVDPLSDDDRIGRLPIIDVHRIVEIVVRATITDATAIHRPDDLVRRVPGIEQLWDVWLGL